MIAVSTGLAHTMSATVDVAEVMPTAIFSVTKYNDPPVMPRATKSSSSRQPANLMSRRQKGNIATYATANLIVIISAGDIPAFSSTLLDANVEPHTIDTASANKCSGHLLAIENKVFGLIKFWLQM